MFGEPKGYIGIKPKITHSREPGRSLWGDYDLTEDYFKALQGKTVPVIDIAVDSSSYLVLGDGEKSGQFIWDINKEDTSQVLIPYNFFHPGPTADDLLKTLSIIAKGGITPCQNFMNQPAIDEALRKHNEDMGEDRYTEGSNVCMECRGEKIMGCHRVCYKALLEVRICEGEYGIWHNGKKDWVRHNSGRPFTRDTLPGAEGLRERLAHIR